MKSYRAKSGTNIVIFMTMTATLSSILVTTSRAQSNGPSLRERNIREREQQLHSLGKPIKLKTEKEARLALVQINEDFLRLQAINNEIKIAMLSGKIVNYKLIADATEEIRKRAVRLKSNLVFAQPEEVERRKRHDALDGKMVKDSLSMLDDLMKGAPDSGQIKTSLKTLDASIKSFTTNPLFQQANVIDTKLSLKASGDLEDIIELSNKIRKSSQKINKSIN